MPHLENKEASGGNTTSMPNEGFIRSGCVELPSGWMGEVVGVGLATGVGGLELKSNESHTQSQGRRL